MKIATSKQLKQGLEASVRRKTTGDDEGADL